MSSGLRANVPVPPGPQPQGLVPIPQGGGAGPGGPGGRRGACGGGGGAGGGGGPGGSTPAGAAAAPFARRPALLSNQALGYSIPANAKLYYKAIMPLETKFDLTQANMKDFLEAFKSRATLMNWQVTMNIMVNGVQLNLIEHYGLVSIKEVRQHVLTYNGTATRDAQNATMIYSCLHDTLMEEARKKVNLQQRKYIVRTDSYFSRSSLDWHTSTQEPRC
jgi:hypothetical protein